MRLSLGYRVVLKVNDSKSVSVPESLVITEGGKKWLKISPINDSIVKLITTDIVFEGGLPKRPSLAEASGLIKLKELRNQLSAHPDAFENSAAAEHFGDDVEAKPKKARYKKRTPTPLTVNIDVGDIEVEFLAVDKKTSEDLCVLLDESSILAVFEYIRSEGISFGQPKRAYVPSGKWVAKKHKNSEDDNSVK